MEPSAPRLHAPTKKTLTRQRTIHYRISKKDLPLVDAEAFEWERIKTGHVLPTAFDDIARTPYNGVTVVEWETVLKGLRIAYHVDLLNGRVGLISAHASPKNRKQRNEIFGKLLKSLGPCPEDAGRDIVVDPDEINCVWPFGTNQRIYGSIKDGYVQFTITRTDKLGADVYTERWISDHRFDVEGITWESTPAEVERIMGVEPLVSHQELYGVKMTKMKFVKHRLTDLPSEIRVYFHESAGEKPKLVAVDFRPVNDKSVSDTETFKRLFGDFGFYDFTWDLVDGTNIKPSHEGVWSAQLDPKLDPWPRLHIHHF